jgi:lambda family phage portal protein
MAKKRKADPDLESKRKAAQERILHAEEAAHREYEAAKRSRRTFHWVPQTLNGNRALLKALPLLQKRHQDLITNNCWARRAIDVIVNSWVSTGMHGYVVDGSERQAEMWLQWTETTDCDFYGRDNLYGLQRLWAGMTANRGSVLIRQVVEPQGPGKIGLRLQTIDPAMLEYLPVGVKLQEDQFTVGGKVFDKDGRVVSYLLKNPADALRGTGGMGRGEPIVVPAEQMIHLYRTEFPDQVTGIPWGVAAMIRARDLDDYESTELLKQKLAACYAAFRVTLDPDENAAEGDDVTDVEPGTVKKLPPGEDMRFATPPQIGSYDVFLRHNQRAIAMAWGVTFEALTGNLTEVNYSSARMGHLQFEKSVKSWRQMMRVQALQRIVEWVNSDPVAGAGGRLARRLKVRWGEPRVEIFDPQKEVKADVEKVLAGFVPLSEIQAQYGNEPRWVMDRLEEEIKDARGRGLLLSVDGQSDAPPAVEPVQGGGSPDEAEE